MNQKVVSGWNRTLNLYIMSQVLFGSETAVMNRNTQTAAGSRTQSEIGNHWQAFTHSPHPLSQTSQPRMPTC